MSACARAPPRPPRRSRSASPSAPELPARLPRGPGAPCAPAQLPGASRQLPSSPPSRTVLICAEPIQLGREKPAKTRLELTRALGQEEGSARSSTAPEAFRGRICPSPELLAWSHPAQSGLWRPRSLVSELPSASASPAIGGAAAHDSGSLLQLRHVRACA